MTPLYICMSGFFYFHKTIRFDLFLSGFLFSSTFILFVNCRLACLVLYRNILLIAWLSVRRGKLFCLWHQGPVICLTASSMCHNEMYISYAIALRISPSPQHILQHPTRPVFLTAFWWMCHFSTFVWQVHHHFTTSVLFSHESPWLEAPLLLQAPAVVLLPLQLWPSVWTGVQFQSAIALDTKTKGSRESQGLMKVVQLLHSKVYIQQ